jgi:hypothetical protein
VPSAETQRIVNAIDQWLATLPPDAYRRRALEIPHDDEYGFETLMAIEPVKRDACPIEIGVTVPAAGSAVAMFVDTWGNVARRLNATVSPGHAARVPLFVEPTSMRIEQVVEACAAVAGGGVHLEAGLFRRRLVSTRGWLNTRTGRFKMRGAEDYLLPFLRTMTRVGMMKVETLRYESWV